MEMCDESSRKRKRSFAEAWLTDDRYKSWIRKVPSDDSLYYCITCNKDFSIHSTHVSRHAGSAYHRNNIKNTSNDDNDPSNKKPPARKPFFKPKWLHIEQFKYWLREVPHDKSLFFCSICNKSLTGGLSQVYRHAESKAHINNINKYEENYIETDSLNEDSDMQIHDPLSSFDELKKSAEIRYAVLIADKNIPYQTAKEILSFFQDIGKDPNVLKSMSMGRTKCTNIITNVLCPVETDHVVCKIQNTKFTLFMDIFMETFDINDKYMTFLVRFVDSETLDICSQLVKLISIDTKDSSIDLYSIFENEMSKLKIPFSNIIALSYNNASDMTEKDALFQANLKDMCPNLLTFSCPCHSVTLASYAASTKIPEFCEEFIKKLLNYLNTNPKRSAFLHEFYESFQIKNRRTLRSNHTRWLSQYLYIEKIIEFWDLIKYFLTEVKSEKTKTAEYLLSMMANVEMKAYFLFLKYVLCFFNTFHKFFQTVETKIHLLQLKSSNLLFQICKNFIKEEFVKPAPSTNIAFSLKKNQKPINEITFGLHCEAYLKELTTIGHINIVRTIRENCLAFYVTAAEEISKRLPINNKFLSKLQIFRPSINLFNNNVKKSLDDIAFIMKTIGFDENAFDDLKQEWIALKSDFTMEEKQDLSKQTFDNMWKKILQRQCPNNIPKYPNLLNVVNIIRSLPNSNVDPEKMFSQLNNIKNTKRNHFSSASINAICVFKSALQSRGETAANMTIDEKYLSLMSADKLYPTTAKKDKNISKSHVTDIGIDIDMDTDIAGPSSS